MQISEELNGNTKLQTQQLRACGVKAIRGGEAIGKNSTDRGRNGSKIHNIVDEAGIPLTFMVTAANYHDSRAVNELLKTYKIHRPTYAGQYTVPAAEYGQCV